jgi:predicted permease
MKTLRRLFTRAWHLAAHRRSDERLREEMEQHIAWQTEENLAAGMPPEEAHRQAVLKFGAVEAVRESYYAEHSLPILEETMQDCRYAFRVLRKTPAFTLSVILTLALGIGANLTVFLVLYGVLLRPLPFPHPHQLVRIERSYPGTATTFPAYSGTEALFFARENRTFASMAAYDFIPAKVNLVQGDGAYPLQLLHATAGFFHVFQMEPILGRGFRPKDMIPNAPGVVVLSNALWRHQFGANPGILGQAITLGNRSYTVIGVANPKFQLDSKVDAWAPLPITESAEDHNQLYNLAGRLKPGVTAAEAASDLRRVHLQFKTMYPALWNQHEGESVLSLHDSITGNLRPALEMLMGAVGLLLLIVTANVLSLLLTRAIARRRDLGVRVALGATGWRMLRQLLVENALLCVGGALAGLAFAWIGTPVLLQLSPLQLPQFASLGVGLPALLFAAVLALVCTLLFSLVPALETRRTRLLESLQLNTTRIAAGRNLAQRALVVCEVTVSLVLLVGASLLLTTFWKLAHTSPGFQAQNVLTFKNSFTSAQAATTEQFSQRVDQLIAKMDAIPGVESAAATEALPTQLTPNLPFSVIGRPTTQSDAMGEGNYLPVTAQFFHTLRIPVLSGRAFTASDTPTSLPVVIINHALAQTYFKNQNPIGQRILIGAGMGGLTQDSVRQIIGVVGNIKQEGLDQPADPSMYLPIAQVPGKILQMQMNLLGESWVVRVHSSRLDVVPAIRRIFLQNAHAPLLSVMPMSAVMDASVAQQRFNMILLCAFGLISLALGGAGLYGVLSYTVAQQKREIGVRMALGARREDIAARVLKDAGRLIAIGLVLGLAASLAGAKILGSLLFGVAPRNPLILAIASLVLLLTGLFAAWWPARRAAWTEPMEALRSE